MKKQMIKRAAILLILVILLGATALPVFAADDTVPNEGPWPQFNGDGIRRFFSGVLARTFRYQSSMTIYIGDALENAEKAADNAYEWIAELESLGKDVGDLEEAVNTFEDLYAEAQDAQESALELVDAHDGFDLRGKVVDLTLARETVRAIEPHLTIAREAIVEALQGIHDAIKEFQDEY